MKLVLTSYYGKIIDYDFLRKSIGDKDDSDILVDLVDDGPDWRFQDDEMQEAVEVVERLKTLQIVLQFKDQISNTSSSLSRSRMIMTTSHLTTTMEKIGVRSICIIAKTVRLRE